MIHSSIVKLIGKYKSNRSSYLDKEYNEELLRNDFLDPFFELLGWDIRNNKGRPTNEREVILGEGLKTSALKTSKKPDYTFRLFSERKFFLEAKRPSVRIKNNNDAAKQTRRYGFTAKLKISALSNFEHLAIYDCSEKVEKTDKYTKARVKVYHYTEYEKKFDEIKRLLGRDSVYNGTFDEEWKQIEDKIKKFNVDDLFLSQINEWREILGFEICKHSPSISDEELNDIVQSYLNSILFLRVCEDRNLEKYQSLLKCANKKDFQTLIDSFTQADKKYNAGLFDQKLKGKIIKKDNSVFWEIIKQLYYPESPYSFSVFSSDVLGNIYEIFLSEKLAIKNSKVILEKKPEHVDRDIITTPIFIIQDILKETVTPLCKDKSDKQILSMKFADIACGSGAFLLETYQLISDTLIDYYLKNDKRKLVQTSISSFKLPFKLKKQILKNCIFGVDKDYNAVQVTQFGLLLKLLETETDQSVRNKQPILPDLSNNILFGNSLLNSSQASIDNQKINPFDFVDTKFDVIVGNPPYMKSEDMKSITSLEFPLYKKYYKTAYKQFDKYFLFIEKGLKLLKNGGYLGFIIPSKFTKVGAGKRLRELLRKSNSIKKIVSFGANQIFRKRTTYTCLLILNKFLNKKFEYFEAKNIASWRLREYKKNDFEKMTINSLDDEVWILVPSYLKSAFNKISSQSETIENLFGGSSVFNGIQTSANSIFVHKVKKEGKKYFYIDKNGKKWKIEKDITKPYYQTTGGVDNLNTYRPLDPNSFVIYPYQKTNRKVKFIEINELRKKFPFTYKYLLYFKDKLKKRDIKPKPQTKNEWYRYGRHQSLEKCEVSEKIIVGVLSVGNKYAIDHHQTLVSSGGTAGYCVISLPEKTNYSIYYLQALLDSKYLEWYSSLIGEVFRGGYIARGTKVIKKLPIRPIDFSKNNEKNIHNKIVKLQKKLIETQLAIDKSQNDKRSLIKLNRKFKYIKQKLDLELKALYNLGPDDDLIPNIAELYGAD